MPVRARVQKRRSWRIINQLLFDAIFTVQVDTSYCLMGVPIIRLSFSNWHTLEQRRPFVTILCHFFAPVTAPAVLLVHLRPHGIYYDCNDMINIPVAYTAIWFVIVRLPFVSLGSTMIQ